MSPDYLASLAHSTTTEPDDHCGYAVSVYHQGAQIATAFHGVGAEQCSFSRSDCDVRAGQVSIRRSPDGSYAVSVDTSMKALPHSVRISAVCTPITAPVGRSTDPEPHAWIIAAPRLRANVDLAVLEGESVRTAVRWHGMGYHDHNLGSRPMQADHGDWFWGRIHDATRTVVYLATPGAAQPFAWLGVADDQGLHICSDVIVSVRQPRISFMGLRCGRTIACSGTLPSGESLVVECANATVVENGPFYQRYLSDWIINGTRITTQGMSEYMDCSRYTRAWIRPFLRTIWQRP